MRIAQDGTGIVPGMRDELSSLVTRRPDSMFSREAFRLCSQALPQVLSDPQNLSARGRMLLGAAFAGMAIETSMLGAAHAAANPLTAHCGLVHGKAVGLMLPAVIRFNGGQGISKKIYAEIGSELGAEGSSSGNGELRGVELLVLQIERLLDLAKFPNSLKECGVERKTISHLAEEAAKQWTAKFNPRPVTEADTLNLYRSAF